MDLGAGGMATVNAGAAFPLDFRDLDLSLLLYGDPITRTSTRLVIDYGAGDRDEFTGVGVTYSALGEPISGTITGYRSIRSWAVAADVTGLNASAAQFMNYVRNADTVGGIMYMLAGHDVINGSAFDDYVAGGAGDDTISGFGGQDYLIGNAGNDLIIGGAGVDTASMAIPVLKASFVRLSDGWRVSDQISGFGTDTLLEIERVQFSDKLVDLSLTSPVVDSYASNILRVPTSPELSMLAANGVVTTAAARSQLVELADATTSVATLAYQFFTGKVPSLAGMDYLVSPTGPNPNNLNSAYYQHFNLENRYINFAVNLGKVGEGRAQFEAEYGGLTLQQATKLAYTEIFGLAPSDAKVAALLSGGRDLYFELYGQDGPNGLGTKAAMVGWLLAEAEKANIGMYAKSNAAFLTDLADGAQFSIDLVGVYGQPDFAYGG